MGTEITVDGLKLPKSDTENCCNRSEALALARMLLASYPNSTPVDQEGYIGLVVTIFSEYSPELVRKAVAPTGIPREVKFLPTTGEIEKWLSEKQLFERKMAAEKPLPRLMSRYIPTPKSEPNLFVPEGYPRYEQMLKLHNETNGKQSRIEKRTSFDGGILTGVWVPLSWWEVRQAPSFSQVQLPEPAKEMVATEDDDDPFI